MDRTTHEPATLAAALLVAALGLTGAVGAAAQPDFSDTHLQGLPSEITAGEAFTFTVHTRNTGEPTTYTRVELPFARGLLLAETAPGCRLSWQAEERRLLWEGSVGRGEAVTCTVTAVLPGEAGTAVGLHLLITSPPHPGAGDVATLDVTSPPPPSAFRLGGGLGVTRAGAVVLAFLAVYLLGLPLIKTLARGRPGRAGSRARMATGGWTMTAIGVGFLAIFASIAWDDWRVLNEWKETRCEVLDGIAKTESAGTSAGAKPRGRRGRDNDIWEPLLLVRHAVDGQPVLALTQTSGSALTVGGGLRAAGAVLSANPRGQSLTCWYDPAAPRKVTVERGFGGAYAFALLPALLLAAGLWTLGRALLR